MEIKYRQHMMKDVRKETVYCVEDIESFARRTMGDVVLAPENWKDADFYGDYEDDSYVWVHNYSEMTESAPFERDDLIDAVGALFAGQDEYVLIETTDL